WELIKDHPVSGVGFGGYWIAITKYHRASGEATPQEAHNDYLELLASGGLIGLSIGVWFVVALVMTARRRLRSRDNEIRAVTLGALAGILAVAVHSLVDFGLHITINALIFTVLVSIISLNLGDAAGKPIAEHDSNRL
ncbi:MAG: O-antigen ligase family protein, partial [Acidobacteriota bacterium]|nr:O-antigen ligase family protein [Acidobacteriota bacterium]